jgi:ATP-dependent DNA helicase DinG
VPQGLPKEQWLGTTQSLLDAMVAAHNALAMVVEMSPEFSILKERIRALREGLTLFLSETEPGYVRWVDVGQQVRMVHSPMDIAYAMQSRVLGVDGGESQGKSWIFTSATLGHDATLGWFLQSCGLESARVLQVQSPFDYPSQAAVYLPRNIPQPSDPGHVDAVAQLVAQGASVLGGRTLVLTTTLRAMRSIGTALRETLVGKNYLHVLVQGEASKRELVERFCNADNSGQPGCVLVASSSFWEGIDVPGDALQLLVIDKLPFAPPDDPLQEAKAAQLQSLGKNAFKELQLPQAAVALKQGAGRLIRRETDRGVLVVCDVRLQQKSYGKKLLAALPAMRRLESPDQWLEALEALTTSSTMDPQWSSPPW